MYLLFITQPLFVFVFVYSCLSPCLVLPAALYLIFFRILYVHFSCIFMCTCFCICVCVCTFFFVILCVLCWPNKRRDRLNLLDLWIPAFCKFKTTSNQRNTETVFYNFFYNSQSLWPWNQKTWNHRYSTLKSKWISDGKSLDQKCGNPDLLGSSHRANRVWQRSVQQSSSNCKIEYLVLWVLKKTFTALLSKYSDV